MRQEKAKDVMLNRTRQIMAGAEMLAKETNDWQLIQAYLTRRIEGIELSPVQQEKLERYQFIYNQLVSGKYTDLDVSEMIQESYGISYVQALQDMRDAKELFSASFNINKQFELKAQMEINRMLIQQAKDAGDFRAATQFEKNRVKMISLIEDQSESLADDFKGHTNILVFDPALLGIEPLEQEKLEDLVKDIMAQHGGKVSYNLGDIEEAEIVEE